MAIQIIRSARNTILALPGIGNGLFVLPGVVFVLSRPRIAVPGVVLKARTVVPRADLSIIVLIVGELSFLRTIPETGA